LKIFTSATEGISILHQSGIIHKDLNLDSIFSNGKALLRIDFPLFTAVEKQQRRAGYFQHANG
jgi:tRNA A-37 threonylcarbamoyl transferase component Bud32